jgi:hypothetical protein
MEPVAIIVAALVAGAAAALKSTAEQAIKDVYASFKALIQSKYGNIASMEALERKPDSETKQLSVREDLTDARAGEDQELLDRAKVLLDAVKAHDRAAAAQLNINLDEIEAAYFKLKDAAAEGNVNVAVKKGAFSGGIDMEGLTAGTPGKK